MRKRLFCGSIGKIRTQNRPKSSSSEKSVLWKFLISTWKLPHVLYELPAAKRLKIDCKDLLSKNIVLGFFEHGPKISFLKFFKKSMNWIFRIFYMKLKQYKDWNLDKTILTKPPFFRNRWVLGVGMLGREWPKMNLKLVF